MEESSTVPEKNTMAVVQINKQRILKGLKKDRMFIPQVDDKSYRKQDKDYNQPYMAVSLHTPRKIQGFPYYDASIEVDKR